MSNCTHKCNECKQAVKKTYGNVESSRYTLYCDCNDLMRMVDISISPTAIVQAPSWCPLNKEVKTEQKKNRFLSYQDKVDALMKFKPMIAWDDIEENHIYHVPKLPGEERKEIFITRKSSFSCSYQIINDKHENTTYILYPSSLMSKFLLEHKIQEFKVVNLAQK